MDLHVDELYCSVCVLSVREGVYVIVKTESWWAVSLHSTVFFAAVAPLDSHDITCDFLSVCAEEAHRYSSGLGGLTAPAVQTRSARARPVSSSRGAAGKCNVLWFPRPQGFSALLPFLRDIKTIESHYYLKIQTANLFLINNFTINA